MSIYINDTKKKTVRHYCTNEKTEKAVETLLKQIEGLVGSETRKGYEVSIKETNAEPVVSVASSDNEDNWMTVSRPNQETAEIINTLY